MSVTTIGNAVRVDSNEELFGDDFDTEETVCYFEDEEDEDEDDEDWWDDEDDDEEYDF